MKPALSLKQLLLLTLPILVGACNTRSSHSEDDLIQANMDSTIRPGDDFFTYSNGNWLKKHPIPASESRWSIAKAVQDEIYARLRTINEEAAKASPATGSNQQKIGDFYAAAMDTTRIDQQGIQPLAAELSRIGAIHSVQDVKSVIAHLQTIGVKALIETYVSQDAKNSEKMALYLWQGGLGLPNRDYYSNTDSRTTGIRKEYITHVANMFKLIGQPSAIAGQNSERVMKLETNLARASRKLADLRDPYANYNKLAVSELPKLMPGVDWKAWLNQLRINRLDTVIIGQPEFYKEANKQLTLATLDDWKAYLTWHLVHSYAATLSRPFDQEDFHFYNTVLEGSTEQRPRWKRVLDQEEAAMGEILGQLFVKDYFTSKTKERYETMAENVIDAFRDHIKKLDWMSAPTKEKALVKLNKIKKKVGYPDKWKDFSTLMINRDSYTQNVLRAREWWYTYGINKLGKPVDRTDWEMTPQTYNAYYNWGNNEIVLPAAIFSIPGLKDEDADDAVIYGYAGASTIGHELTHGFDDQGSQFDEKGNLRNWWTKKDRTQFEGKVNQIVKQFDQYTVLDSMHVNGRATAGENIADLGGIVIALDAFKQTEQYKKGEKISGLTPIQRYFMGYSMGWQGHQRDQRLAQQILTDVHSPGILRVNGPLSDVTEFYQAFNIRPGQALWRPDSLRVTIW